MSKIYRHVRVTDRIGAAIWRWKRHRIGAAICRWKWHRIGAAIWRWKRHHIGAAIRRWKWQWFCFFFQVNLSFIWIICYIDIYLNEIKIIIFVFYSNL